VDDARLAAQQTLGEPRGTLRLTCGVEFGMLAVGRWINRYLQTHPQMKVDGELTGRIVDVLHEGFDLAIRMGPLADSTLAARRRGALAYALYERIGNRQGPHRAAACSAGWSGETRSPAFRPARTRNPRSRKSAALERHTRQVGAVMERSAAICPCAPITWMGAAVPDPMVRPLWRLVCRQWGGAGGRGYRRR
jgi:DNA-binding transcriptional LysR family regulator